MSHFLLLAVISTSGCHPFQSDVLAQAAQAQRLLDAGQPAAAQKIIDEAIRERDDITFLYLTQARIALAVNNRPTGYRAYANALALEAVNPEALLGVAQLGVSTGHLREAESAADQLLSLNPEQKEALLVKAIAAVVRHNYDDALSFSDKILKIAPNDIGGLIVKSRALALNGNLPAALALMQVGAAKTGESPEIAMSLVELHRAAGNAPAYLAMVRKVRALAPDNLGYRYDLIEALYKLGDRNSARLEVVGLLTATLKQPDLIEQIIRLWYGYDVEALTPKQLKDAGQTMSLEARLAIARYLIATDRPQPAAELLRPIATGWSKEVQALYARAIDRAGGGAAAEQMAEAILAQDPENGDALLVRARRALLAGQPHAAIISFQRVISNYPTWDEGYLGLAAAFAAAENPSGLRRAFEQGIQARPQSFPLTAAYVARLPGLGDRQRAVEVARRFALASPALPRAWILYTNTCHTYAGNCTAEAAAGLVRSRSLFGLDPAPGAPPPITLIGRIT